MHSCSWADYLGEFKYTESCSCSCENYVCTNIQYIKVFKTPLSDTIEVMGSILTVLTLGIVQVDPSGTINNHYIVEIKIKCKKCGKEFYWTTDFCDDDDDGTIKNRFGQFSIFKRTINSENINKPFVDAMLALPRRKTYNLHNYNCRHYAYEAYNCIRDPYSSSYYENNEKYYKVKDGYKDISLESR